MTSIVVALRYNYEDTPSCWWYENDALYRYRNLKSLPKWAVPYVATYGMLQENARVEIPEEGVTIVVSKRDGYVSTEAYSITLDITKEKKRDSYST